MKKSGFPIHRAAVEWSFVLSFLLDASTPVGYRFNHESALSDRFQRASARAARRAISYHSLLKRPRTAPGPDEHSGAFSGDVRAVCEKLLGLEIE